MFETTIKIYTVISGTVGKNDDCYRKGRGGRVSKSDDRNYHKRKWWKWCTATYLPLTIDMWPVSFCSLCVFWSNINLQCSAFVTDRWCPVHIVVPTLEWQISVIFTMNEISNNLCNIKIIFMENWCMNVLYNFNIKRPQFIFQIYSFSLLGLAYFTPLEVPAKILFFRSLGRPLTLLHP